MTKATFLPNGESGGAGRGVRDLPAMAVTLLCQKK